MEPVFPDKQRGRILSIDREKRHALIHHGGKEQVKVSLDDLPNDIELNDEVEFDFVRGSDPSSGDLNKRLKAVNIKRINPT